MARSLCWARNQWRNQDWVYPIKAHLVWSQAQIWPSKISEWPKSIEKSGKTSKTQSWPSQASEWPKSIEKSRKTSKSQSWPSKPSEWPKSEGTVGLGPWAEDRGPTTRAQDGGSGTMGPGPWARDHMGCLLYTSPSPRDRQKSRMPSSA